MTAAPKKLHPAVNISAWLLELPLEPLAVAEADAVSEPDADDPPCCG